MSTKLNNEQKIKKAFDELFNDFTEDEKLESEARLIMFRFLDIVERKREELGWTRKQFAEKVGTSASYITQLMRGDKLINMLTLAKMQKVLDVQFDISELKSTEDHKVNFDVPKVGKNGFWVFKKFNPDYDSNEPIPNPDKQEIAA